MPDLGLGNIHGSALGERGVSKRLDALADLAPLKGDRLLDVGCAAGEYTRVLAEGFDATDAIDIEPERLAVFSQALTHSAIADRIHVLNMSAEQLTFRDGAFDVVTAIETLEHVVDLDAALDEMRRVLKPGGYLLVTGPNRYFPLETHGWLWKGKRHSPASFPFLPWLRPVHRKLADARSFTVHSLRERVEPHGFQLIGSSYLMPPFDRKLKALRALDKLERSPLRFFGLTLVMGFRAV